MDSPVAILSDMPRMVHWWFEQARQAYGPILPDGWFGGRPYENAFALRDVSTAEQALVIHLSEDTMLTLEGPMQLEVDHSQLVFSKFQKASLSWRDYGGTQCHNLAYESGEIRFAPPLGVVVRTETRATEQHL